jgi:hypothetical protein
MILLAVTSVIGAVSGILMLLSLGMVPRALR